MSERIPAEKTGDLDAPETEVLDVTDVTSYEVSHVVVTRAQTLKAARPVKPLPVLCHIDTASHNH